MKPVYLHDKNTIEQFFRREPELNIYSIGDLDDYFWPYTIWFALKNSRNDLIAIALLYSGLDLPTLLALSDQTTALRDLLESIVHLQPSRFYAHLSPGLEHVFHKNSYRIEPHGKHYKMTLKERLDVNSVNCSEATCLSQVDHEDIVRLFNESYPDNWFDRKMLETGQYFGIRKEEKLVSIAGVHVYSEKYRVAALGNITTHPLYRKRGLGTIVTARLCQSLMKKTDLIGLNVKSDNQAAISCYEKLGFRIVGSYGEFLIEKL